MRCLALTLILASVAVSSASPAQASNATVRATFGASVARFNVWWKAPDPASASAAAAAASGEVTRLTVARTKLQIDHTTTARAKVGRALALQALSRMIAGCQAISDFKLELVGNGGDPTTPRAEALALKASGAFGAARPLLAAAAHNLGVKIQLFRFR